MRPNCIFTILFHRSNYYFTLPSFLWLITNIISVTSNIDKCGLKCSQYYFESIILFSMESMLLMIMIYFSTTFFSMWSSYHFQLFYLFLYAFPMSQTFSGLVIFRNNLFYWSFYVSINFSQTISSDWWWLLKFCLVAACSWAPVGASLTHYNFESVFWLIIFGKYITF